MRDYMEPFGVRTDVNIHLYEEGRASFRAYPDEDRAVIKLQTTAVDFALYVDADNLRRVAQVIADAEAALMAGAADKVA